MLFVFFFFFKSCASHLLDIKRNPLFKSLERAVPFSYHAGWTFWRSFDSLSFLWDSQQLLISTILCRCKTWILWKKRKRARSWSLSNSDRTKRCRLSFSEHITNEWRGNRIQRRFSWKSVGKDKQCLLCDVNVIQQIVIKNKRLVNKCQETEKKENFYRSGINWRKTSKRTDKMQQQTDRKWPNNRCAL